MVLQLCKMKNMGTYHDYYSKADVLVLAVFKKFIDTCLKLYKLDPKPGYNVK